MTKPGPSKEYRDLLNGRISADDYLRKLKKDVDRHLQEQHPPRSGETARDDDHRAAAR
jgi:hypothetical protein